MADYKWTSVREEEEELSFGWIDVNEKGHQPSEHELLQIVGYSRLHSLFTLAWLYNCATHCTSCIVHCTALLVSVVSDAEGLQKSHSRGKWNGERKLYVARIICHFLLSFHPSTFKMKESLYEKKETVAEKAPASNSYTVCSSGEEKKSKGKGTASVRFKLEKEMLLLALFH